MYSVLTETMFGLFKKKEYKPAINDADKQWVEKNLMWYIETFGLEHLSKGAFYLPVIEVFPYTDLTQNEQFEKLFIQLCTYLKLDANEIYVEFFDDIGSLEWSTWTPQGEYDDIAGMYYRVYTLEEKRYRIHIAKSRLKNYENLISTLVHELCHVKLLGGDYMSTNDEELELLNDLACIFFGFGIFIANSRYEFSLSGTGISGYLPAHFIAYANACLCFILNDDAHKYYEYFNLNSRSIVKQNYEFLIKVKDTELYKDKIEELIEIYNVYTEADELFKERDFKRIIEIGNSVLIKHPNHSGIMSNVGYALLQNKEYEKAIEVYTEMISQYNYWFLPYYNRGYCKLQLGDFDSAFPDLYTALQMNEENAYTWRNMGVYYLMLRIYDKALSHLEQAEKTDPNVELINFFLSKTHRNLGKSERADELLKKSEEKNEYNDTVIV